MKLTDLAAKLGAPNTKELRDIAKRLGLQLTETARSITDEQAAEIEVQYREDHAPLLRRSVGTDRSNDIIPTKEDILSLSSTVQVETEEDRKQKAKLKREEEKKKKQEEEKKKEEEERAKAAAAQVKKMERKVVTIEDDSLGIDLDLEDETPIVEDEVDEEEELEEELEEEFEKEVKKAKKVKPKNEEEDDNGTVVAHREKMKVVLKPKDNVMLPDVISVKEFSEKIGVPASKIIAELLKNGIIVTINHKIDFETAALVASEFNLQVQKEEADFTTSDLLQGNLSKLLENEDPEKLTDRPPIVSIMGHVDHGKTSLLDYIRSAKVAASEAGGITQQIGAYQVETKGKKITFLDTPGHEAFTAMRARGAKATDIAILVIAADEGVKPQTEEAINHAREAGIPIIVALNKMDKEGANAERVKGQLAEKNVIPEEWGGDTVVTEISAKTGDGIDNLLDIILLVAEMGNLKADPERSALGTIIEAHLDPSLGPVATVIINTGRLNLMDNIVVGEAYGRVKIMQDAKGKRLKSANPSTPVRIAGFSETPHVGDILQVVKSEKVAREKAVEIKSLRANSSKGGASFSDIITRIGSGELKQLKVVLKADTKGSLEAVRNSLLKLNTDEVQVSIIHSGIGNITETDVLMASASGGLILAFSVSSSAQVDKTAEKMNVTIKHYRVIYHLTEEIHKLLSGMLDPEIREVSLGDFTVLQVFFASRKFMILGGKVSKGKMENRAQLRIIRGDKLVGTGRIESLQKGMDSVSELAEGYEGGIKFVGDCTPEPKDILEAFKIEKIERSL